MAFRLHIVFGGLCLFVPQRGASGRMHVLMPPMKSPDHDGPSGSGGDGGGHHRTHGSGGEGHHGHEPHLARLAFDRAYTTPGQQQTSGTWECEPLEQRSLDLSYLPSKSPLKLEIGREVVNLKPVVGSRVSPSLLHGAAPRGRLVSRITLPHGSGSPAGRVGVWKLDPLGEVRMATNVVWTMDVDRDTLPIRLARLDPGGTPQELELHPIGGAVEVHLLNVPEDELPPHPAPGRPLEPGEAATHFEAYYNLFDSYRTITLPRYVSEETLEHDKSAEIDVTVRGSRLTCMVGGGDEEEG